jgi:3'-phosphoadenosine 5'-phosphosulfate sulfotransferase (PAPS reductase)/FAD synthetase
MLCPDQIPLDRLGTPIWPELDAHHPFYCEGPTLVSFSGGRTSALMLFLILWAHGGRLPDHVVVAFANTGREREETLRFVHECEARWRVPIYWVEWRPPPARRKAGEPKRQIGESAAMRFERVGFNSADRSGRWFAELIRRKQFLPNQDMRYCTTSLKIETMKHLMLALGYRKWRNVVGLRADEPHRVLKQFLRNQDARERWQTACPLFMTGILKRFVTRFWLGRNRDPKRITSPLPMGFDLGLMDYEGNCDLCFLKGRGRKARIIRERPDLAGWWVEQEAQGISRQGVVRRAAMFDKRISMIDLIALVESSPELDAIVDPDGRDDADAECGVSCIGEAGGEEFEPEAIEWLRAQMARQLADPPRLNPRRKVAAALGDLFGEAA